MKPILFKAHGAWYCVGSNVVGVGDDERGAYDEWARVAKPEISYIECPVPKITDPLGRHWRQPDPSRFFFTPIHVFMKSTDLEDLLVYSSSTPSGVYPGKMWRRLIRDGWALVWYGVHDDPKMCSIESRKVILVD